MVVITLLKLSPGGGSLTTEELALFRLHKPSGTSLSPQVENPYHYTRLRISVIL